MAVPKNQLATVPAQPTDGVVAQYNPDQVNLLVPTQQIQQVSPWHAARVSEVRVDADPYKGDVFKVGSRKKRGTSNQYEDLYSPGKPALMRIAAAAGIVWNWRDSGPVTAAATYVLYRAVGALRLPDGSWQPVMATKEIDLDVISEEIRDAETKKVADGIWGEDAKRYRGQWQEVQGDEGGRKNNRYFLADDEVQRCVEDRVRTQLIQWRKNKLMRAETGAMLRVIRAALGMRSQYTAEELNKPFVVPRIDFSPDYNDPQVRQAMIEHGAKGMQTLFGQAAAPSSATAFLPPGAGEGDQVRTPLLMGSGSEDHDDLPPIETGSEPEGEGDDTSWMAGGEDEAGAPTDPKCADCRNKIGDEMIGDKFYTAPEIAESSRKRFGRELCLSCGSKAAQAARAARQGGGRS